MEVELPIRLVRLAGGGDRPPSRVNGTLAERHKTVEHYVRHYSGHITTLFR